MNSAEAERRLIDGRFELLQQLGGGGMGLVWRARDTALKREVVLKEVRPMDPAMAAADPAAARELRERVLREAQALARLQHPNVVIIHHIVDSPEHPHPWLVMELVTGGSLADRLAQGPLGTAEAARIGRGVLAALRAAHAVGIQHRDVKPGNVLLRPDGTPVLADFGIAAMQDATALTATGALIGSPEYIAPERIRGQEGNASSDLWSLGMLLYVAVEGRHPLRRATTLATLAAVLDEPLPHPERAGRLGPMLTALLAKDPATRPDADQLDRLLAAAEQDAPVPAVEHTPTAYVAPGPVADRIPTGYAAPVPVADRIPTGYAAPVPVVDGIPTGYAAPPTSGRGRTVAVVAAVAAVAVVGAGTFVLLRPDGRTATSGATASVTTSVAPAAALPSAAGLPSKVPSAAASTAKGDLMTPDGVRRTIQALQPYASDGKVYELVIYPDFATAKVPVGAKLYDDITYRDGKATRKPGGENIRDEKPIDLQAYNWDVIPSLLQKAQDTLNVPNPTMRFLKVDSDLMDGTPCLMVYRIDDYGTGYLETDPKGTVTRTYARSS
ncbi:serine/threonine protein kinase [Streptomyces kaniharaensis]|uniref:non-specific serine/threonine protein kinase n=1 Tax=Streptomyces kaniharaensis TaxID=212423 RepID=A0A6N7KZ12_9ACTN|nr:serine/threonine-protein kinase [Streptomyces kaniharaensis]MQS15799.1 serine/threonine protein kinase [Streptomyces kaniharaensis]